MVTVISCSWVQSRNAQLQTQDRAAVLQDRAGDRWLLSWRSRIIHLTRLKRSQHRAGMSEWWCYLFSAAHTYLEYWIQLWEFILKRAWTSWQEFWRAGEWREVWKAQPPGSYFVPLRKEDVSRVVSVFKRRAAYPLSTLARRMYVGLFWCKAVLKQALETFPTADNREARSGLSTWFSILAGFWEYARSLLRWEQKAH